MVHSVLLTFLSLLKLLGGNEEETSLMKAVVLSWAPRTPSDHRAVVKGLGSPSQAENCLGLDANILHTQKFYHVSMFQVDVFV